MEKVSIIIPVVRPEAVERCKAAIRLNAGIPEDQYEIVTIEDKGRIGCPAMVSKLTMLASNDLVMFLGDDTIPGPNFLKEALDKMAEIEWGVVGLNTKPNNQIAHWLADKRMLELIPGGKFFSIEYKHCWCDNELYDIATENGRWAYAEKVYIDHIHPINQTAKYDEHYQRAYNEEFRKYDFQTYCRRKKDRVQNKYGTKLAIAVPVTDQTVYKNFMFSFLKMVTEYTTKGKSVDILFPETPAPIDMVRNSLVKQALIKGCTHILFADSDQIYYTDNLIERLMAHNMPIVGARVHRRYPPFDAIILNGEIGKLYSLPDSDIQNEDGTFKDTVPCKYTGTGCLLIDMSIFIDMIPTEDKFFELTTSDKGTPVGEDIAWFDKVKKKNIPVIVDASIEIGHMSIQSIDWSMHELYNKTIKK